MPSDEVSELAALPAALGGAETLVTDRLLDLAQAHGVEALLARAPGARAATDAVRSRLDALLAGYEVLSALRARELTRVLEHLSASGVTAVVIKGWHLAYTVYRTPALRPREDVDLVVGEEAMDAAAAALAQAGYSRRLHVRGALILGQCHFQRADRPGILHAVDLHWRVASPLVFRRVLPAAALCRSRVPIPALGPHAWGPSRPHALIIACVHLAAHHRGYPILMWLNDMARLAERFDEGETAAFLDEAASARVNAVCALALNEARRHFDGPALEALARRTAAAARASDEPSARVLTAARPIDDLWLDLRVCDSWRERGALLRDHLLPDPDYVRATSGGIRWLPLAYTRRAVLGARKWFSPVTPSI